MGGRLLDYIAQGDHAARPLAASMPASIQAGGASIYYSNDGPPFIMSFFNDDTVAWDELNLSALTGLFQDLTDVDWSTPPTDGQIFKWDAGSSKLIPFTPPTPLTGEDVMDIIATMIAAGVLSGITITYDDAGNFMSFAVTVTQYTDEMAQDAFAALIAAGTNTGLIATYNDAGNLISITIDEASSANMWAGSSSSKVVTPKKLKDWRTPVSVADAATITLDGTTGVNFYTTLGGNRAIANPTNFAPGQFGVYKLTQDGTGNRVPTFGSNWKTSANSPSGGTLSTAAGAVDSLHYYVHDDGIISYFVVKGETTTPIKTRFSDLGDVDMSTPPTNGQVPAWDSGTSKWKPGAGAGAGALILLEQHAAANSPTLDFTAAISATYDEYMIEFVNVIPATNAVNLYMRMSTNGGSTYDSGANYSHVAAEMNRFGAPATAGADATNQIIINKSSSSLDNTATKGLCGSIRLFSPGSTSVHKSVVGLLTAFVGGGVLESISMTGCYLSTTAVNAFHFLMSGGNISSGTIRVYGVAK